MMQKCVEIQQIAISFGGLVVYLTIYGTDFRVPPSQAVSDYAEVSTHLENLNKSEMWFKNLDGGLKTWMKTRSLQKKYKWKSLSKNSHQ